MSLQNLQAEFFEVIFSNHQEINFVSQPQNMAVYQHNVISNLTNALFETYPLIAKLVGEDFFRMAAKEYIARYPSCSGNLHDYGEYFGDFLADYSPSKHLVYLNEIAQFEWACHLVFFSANPTPFNSQLLETIQSDQYDQLYFSLHPASRLMKCRYPIFRIIDLCKGEMDETIDLNEGGVCLLIIRRDLEISLMPLTTAEFIFLTAIQDNQSLSESLQKTLDVDTTFQLEVKLPEWIQNKTIVDCYLK